MGDGGSIEYLSSAIHWMDENKAAVFGSASAASISIGISVFILSSNNFKSIYIRKIENLYRRLLAECLFALIVFSFVEFVFSFIRKSNNELNVYFIFSFILFLLTIAVFIVLKLLKFLAGVPLIFRDAQLNREKEKILRQRYKSGSRNMDLSDMPNSHQLVVEKQNARAGIHVQDGKMDSRPALRAAGNDRGAGKA